MSSVIGSASLLKKAYVPKYIFTLSKITSSMVNFVLSLGALLIGVLIGFPISITNIIPVAAFADLAQFDSIQTGQNRQAMFVASRNLLQQLSQAVVLVIVPIAITGSISGSSGTNSNSGFSIAVMVTVSETADFDSASLALISS